MGVSKRNREEGTDGLCVVVFPLLHINGVDEK